MIEPIPFERIQAASLAQAECLLRRWFPRGKRIGNEFAIGNLRGDAGDSLKVNLRTGKWSDFATDDSGHDLIDLAAKLWHRGDRIKAGCELGKQLGIIINDTPKPVHRTPAQRGEWRPSIPPPADAARPGDDVLRGFDMVHEYTDLCDRVTHYVGRIEARPGRKKQFIPITFGVLNGKRGWHRRGPDIPKPLYGLNRLSTLPDATVLLCEGEKAADAAQRLFPDHACVSWFGGVASVEHAELSPIVNRRIIIWPDADKAGVEAAIKLSHRLPHARTLDVSDLEDGADAADVHLEDPDAWLAARLPPDLATELRQFLSIHAWADRDIPPPDRLLGDLLTTTSRMFLVGRTGLGKTMLGMGMACGMATGRGFLHWRSMRSARVLYIDGEMPAELVKARAIDVLRRAGIPPHPDNLLIFARDTMEEFATRYPSLGQLAPLNTEEGQNFVHGLIRAVGGADIVLFDNVMSLIAGDQKDELPWSETLPLVSALTTKRVGQVWLDHTGHNTDRQYGSATKAWRFDAVGLMKPLPDDQRNSREVAFTLSFEPPGKARRRTPDNWQDFETCTIRLREDQWTSEPVNRSSTKLKPVSPSRKVFHDALLDAIAAGNTVGPGQVSRRAWESECIRRNLIQPRQGYTESETKRLQAFRRAIFDLQVNGWIGCNGDIFSDLSRPYVRY
jgi:AAA domain